MLKARRPLWIGTAGLFCLALLFSLYRASFVSIDPDPVDFDRVGIGKGRYLICPADLCASRDEETALLTISAERMTQKLRAAALAMPHMREVALPVANQLRFIETSPVLGMERVIDVRIVPRSSGASTFAMLGRPANALLDFGATQRRIRELTEALAR